MYRYYIHVLVHYLPSNILDDKLHENTIYLSYFFITLQEEQVFYFDHNWMLESLINIGEFYEGWMLDSFLKLEGVNFFLRTKPDLNEISLLKLEQHKKNSVYS